MEKRLLTFLCFAVFLFALIGVARAEDDSFFTQFLETPLLILAILIVINVIAFIYYRTKK